MKPVDTGGVLWKAHPFLPSTLETPGQGGAVGPLHDRHDLTTVSPGKAVLTPSATQPEEVISDVVPGEGDDQGSVGDC